MRTMLLACACAIVGAVACGRGLASNDAPDTVSNATKPPETALMGKDGGHIALSDEQWDGNTPPVAQYDSGMPPSQVHASNVAQYDSGMPPAHVDQMDAGAASPTAQMDSGRSSQTASLETRGGATP